MACTRTYIHAYVRTYIIQYIHAYMSDLRAVGRESHTAHSTYTELAPPTDDRYGCLPRRIVSCRSYIRRDDLYKRTSSSLWSRISCRVRSSGLDASSRPHASKSGEALSCSNGHGAPPLPPPLPSPAPRPEPLWPNRPGARDCSILKPPLSRSSVWRTRELRFHMLKKLVSINSFCLVTGRARVSYGRPAPRSWFPL